MTNIPEDIYYGNYFDKLFYHRSCPDGIAAAWCFFVDDNKNAEFI